MRCGFPHGHCKVCVLRTSKVLSPKKWMWSNSCSTNCRQYVLSHPYKHPQQLTISAMLSITSPPAVGHLRQAGSTSCCNPTIVASKDKGSGICYISPITRQLQNESCDDCCIYTQVAPAGIYRPVRTHHTPDPRMELTATQPWLLLSF